MRSFSGKNAMTDLRTGRSFRGRFFVERQVGIRRLGRRARCLAKDEHRLDVCSGGGRGG